MTRFGSSVSRARFAVLLIFAFILAPLTLQAGESDSESMQDRPSDFMIHKPGYFLGVHAGMNFPRAESDLFQMVTRELTLEKSDFRNPPIGFDLGVILQDHFALVFSGEYGRKNKKSEFRDFVEDNGRPITQETNFRLFTATATLRYYPLKLGETVGSYAWIPRRVLPYVGGGGGFIHYTFRQAGDFVDKQTYDIFYASLVSSGWAPMPFVASGIDIGLSPAVFINMEARYSWAQADLSRDFGGFQPIDLSDLRVVGGINVRF
jgi:hypothetical protein